MGYFAIITASIIGPLYALREWRMARRETLVERIAHYSMRRS